MPRNRNHDVKLVAIGTQAGLSILGRSMTPDEQQYLDNGGFAG
jgi:hypothetical protein